MAPSLEAERRGRHSAVPGRWEEGREGGEFAERIEEFMHSSVCVYVCPAAEDGRNGDSTASTD